MTQNWISIAESNWIFSNLNIIDSYSYFFLNSLKCLVRMLLGGKCKLSILFYIFLCSLILDSLILVHNNSLEWILMIWSHI